MRFDIETPGDDTYAELNARLVAFNEAHVPWQPDRFTVAARDEDGVLCGGARATVNMGLVEVRGLWLDESVRGTGLGREIMVALEKEARRRGASRAALDTYDFQARAFYEHIGYRLFGWLAYPAGVERFYMTKEL